MKKLLSLLLVLAMMLGCVAFAEAADYLGVWTLTGVDVGGMTMDPLALGMQITMDLQEGGVCVLTSADMVEEGTWAVTDAGVEVTDATDYTMVCVPTDGMLVAEEDGVKMIFTYGEVEATVVELVVLSDVPAEDFEGQWLLSKVTMYGMTFTAEELEAYMAFVLSEGTGIYAEKDAEGNLVQLDVIYTITEDEELGTLLEMVYAPEGIEPIPLMTLNMLEDGSLYMEMDVEGIIVGYYFEQPVEEEAAE